MFYKLHWSEKRKKNPQPFKNPLGSNVLVLLVSCLLPFFHFFHQLQNAPMYRRNAQVWSIKGDSYILTQRPGSDQLLTFSFSQRNKKDRVSTNLSFLFKSQYKGTNFLTVYSFYLSFIAFSFYSRTKHY